MVGFPPGPPFLTFFEHGGFRALRGAARDAVPGPCRLLKKAGENFNFWANNNYIGG